MFGILQISFDFNLRFPTVNSKALALIWPTIKKNVALLSDTPTEDADLKTYKKFPDIRYFIKLLKLLPISGVDFKTALKSMLTFSTVNHENYCYSDDKMKCFILSFFSFKDPQTEPTSLMEKKSCAKIIAI